MLESELSCKLTTYIQVKDIVVIDELTFCAKLKLAEQGAFF